MFRRSQCRKRKPYFCYGWNAELMTRPLDDLDLKMIVDERDRLFATAFRIVDNRAIAEELVQETWLRWHKSRYKYQTTRSLLLSIVKNLAIDWHRRRRVEFEVMETQRLVQDLPHDAERIVAARQQLERAIRVIETLSPKARLAFRCTRVEGMTLREAGERLGVSESRTSQLVSDVIVRIAAVLEE